MANPFKIWATDRFLTKRPPSLSHTVGSSHTRWERDWKTVSTIGNLSVSFSAKRLSASVDFIQLKSKERRRTKNEGMRPWADEYKVPHKWLLMILWWLVIMMCSCLKVMFKSVVVCLSSCLVELTRRSLLILWFSKGAFPHFSRVSTHPAVCTCLDLI